ncbi:MAG: periplasmic heavy metal sensor [Ferruginibacter sp.]
MNNFTNNRWVPVITWLLLTANIITLTLLWTGKKQGGRAEKKFAPPTGQVFEFLTHELQLDTAQQEAYKKLRDEHQAGMRDIRNNIQRKAKEALFELLKKPAVSDSEVHIYSGRAAAADQQLDEFTFHHFQKLRAICRPVQQEKFDSIIQETLRRMGGPKRPPVPTPGMERGEGGPPH